MPVLYRPTNVPRGHLKQSTHPLMGKFMFTLPPWVISPPLVHRNRQKKRVMSVSHLLTPWPHLFFCVCPLNQFLPSLSLSRHPSVVYPISFLLHHSFSTPLLSSHTLISWPERCFLRRACRQTGGSDGSLWGCFTLSSLQGGNKVVMGRWSPGLVKRLWKEKTSRWNFKWRSAVTTLSDDL